MTKIKTWNYWDSGSYPSSGILKNTTFPKLDLFPTSGMEWEASTLLGTLERVKLCPAIEVSSFSCRRKQIQFQKYCVL